MGDYVHENSNNKENSIHPEAIVNTQSTKRGLLWFHKLV